MSVSIRDQVARLYADESRHVLATLIRLLGDIDQAEEALQEAFTAALDVWPRKGIPQNPRAWLISTGRFKGIDAIRRRGRGRQAMERMANDGRPTFAEPQQWTGDSVLDDHLRLIFICCHPALTIDARVALSLRMVCGLTTEEVAQSFLVPMETMKKRITRAKATIRNGNLPYEVPIRSELGERLDAVLHTIYLVYNEGYSATSGQEHQRRDLAAEAVRLSRLVARLLPAPEATGLLALLLLHESRSAVRTDLEGDPVPLEEQDRSLWDRELIDEGLDLVRRSVMSGRVGAYGLQATIASVHASADSVEGTNWELIVQYYDMLVQLQDSPVVALQRAIAVGMKDGPERGLKLIDNLMRAGTLSNYHQAHAARAEFAHRAGFPDEARASYRRALDLVKQAPERRYLERRLATLEGSLKGS